MADGIEIAAAYVSATTLAWDGYVVDTNLYIAYNTTTGGQAVKVAYLTQGLTLATAVTFGTYKATMVSVTADMTVAAAHVVYVSFYRSDTSVGYTLAVDTNLNTLMAPVQIVAAGTILNITSAALNGPCAVYLEVSAAYSYDGSIPTNFIDLNVVNLASATAGGRNALIRSVGLASKAFIIEGVVYLLAAYQSPYQPTYFLVNGSTSTSAAPVLAGKLAYQNGGGYLTLGLPGVTVSGTYAQMAYRFKDLIQAVNKNTAVPSGSQIAGIYSQTGINLGSFDFVTTSLDAAEIGGDLHLSGGFLWMAICQSNTTFCSTPIALRSRRRLAPAASRPRIITTRPFTNGPTTKETPSGRRRRSRSSKPRPRRAQPTRSKFRRCG